MTARIDVGTRFGRLVVVSEAVRNKWGRRQFLCKCDCGGAEVVVPLHGLRAGNTQSCGCLHRETSAQNGKHNKTHGMIFSPEYSSWQAMKTRCLNPKDVAYPRYGGRGITIYGAWIDDFSAFLADMGPRPAGYTLERLDVNGNYTPDNTVWAGARRQAQNRRCRSKWGVGVSQPRTGKWLARIEDGGKNYHLGVFDTVSAAREAYVQAERSIKAGEPIVMKRVSLEERRAAGRKAYVNGFGKMTPQERSAAARKWRAASTPEERSIAARKGVETRRRNREARPAAE